MKIVRQVLIALVFGSIGANAFAALEPNDRAERWWSVPASDREMFARQMASACKSSNCGNVEIRACLNEALRPPMPAAARNMTIAEAATTCIILLKSRQ